MKNKLYNISFIIFFIKSLLNLIIKYKINNLYLFKLWYILLDIYHINSNNSINNSQFHFRSSIFWKINCIIIISSTNT